MSSLNYIDATSFEYKSCTAVQHKTKTQVWCAYVLIPLEIAKEIGIYKQGIDIDLDAVRRLYGCMSFFLHNECEVIIGFVCGHSSDWVPIHDDRDDEYYHRTCPHASKEITLEYVQNECRSIIDQIEAKRNRQNV